MNRPFENFTASCLEQPKAAAARPEPQNGACERWDGEGGNTCVPAVHRKRIRANALTRLRGHSAALLCTA